MDDRNKKNDNIYYTEYDNMNGTSYSNNGNYNDYNNTSNYYTRSAQDIEGAESKIMTKSFLIVLIALVVTAATATIVVSNIAIAQAVYSSFMFWIIAELVVVFAATAAIGKKKTALASVLFGAYAIINGLTLSVFFFAYSLGSIQEVFLLTAGMFAGMALIGATTHIDLTKMGSFLIMAIWGIILTTVVNLLFIHSTGLNLLMDYVGVAIFVGLTAYDTQKMKRLARSGNISSANVIALYCGMQLYLDFINLFIRLLSILGKNRN